MDNSNSSSSNGLYENNIKLENIFNRIIGTNEVIELNLQSLNYIIQNEFDFNVSDLNETQRKLLPYMLSRYIMNWPGWSKKAEYISGSIDLESWLLRFRNFISYKMQFLVTKILPSMKEDNLSIESEINRVELRDVEVQTDPKIHFSKFCIELNGPASLLSNLVFSGNMDDIKMEEHAERQWLHLSCKDLLNYPFIEVEFNSPELSFKRSFEPKLNQYLSYNSDTIMEESEFILGKTSIHSNNSKWPIQTSILEKYIKTFTAEISVQLMAPQQEELNAVLEQFYQDMLDISTNNVVFENMRVAFNIGNNIYKRTKKICNSESLPDVIFHEVYLPRAISSFRYFTGMQNDSTARITADPDKIDRKLMLSFKPVISYKCTFCKTLFKDLHARFDLVNHLMNFHKRAQTLLCSRCKKCVEVAVLSRQRWKCECQN